MTYMPILLVNLFLLGVGLAVILTKRSTIFIIIGIELIVQASISNYIVFNSLYSNQLDGQMFAIFTTAISICEIVMVLAISLRLYQQYKINELDQE
jgi:NADH:ubiquinone oxidoreductase subunit K